MSDIPSSEYTIVANDELMGNPLSEKMSPPFVELSSQDTQYQSTQCEARPESFEAEASLLPQVPTAGSSEFEAPLLESDTQRLRIACAEAYEQAARAFLNMPSVENLEELNRTVLDVHADDLDQTSSEKLVCTAQELLDAKSTSTILLACQLAIHYDLKSLQSSHLRPAGDIGRYVEAFGRCSTPERLEQQDQPLGRTMSLLARTVELWIALVKNGSLEEYQSHLLVLFSVSWIFCGDFRRADGSNMRHQANDLLVAVYSGLPRQGRYRVVNDLISRALRSDKNMHSSVRLLVRLVAVTGSISLSAWREATMLRKRHLVESEAKARHADAVALSKMISRKIIEHAYNTDKATDGRNSAQNFQEECISSLMSPQLPSAEILLSSFVSTLFSLSLQHRDRKYCLLSFSLLRTLHDTLAAIQDHRDRCAVNVLNLIAGIQSPDQAIYLASRQCTLEEQPYFDLQLALEKPYSIEHFTPISESEWLAYLGQWPISGYYTQICDQICTLADREDIPDTVQVEIFKMVERIVTRSPSSFKIRWLDRLSYASPSVCDALVPVVAALFHSSNVPAAFSSYLHKLGTRLAVPGVRVFKKRAIFLFSSVARVNEETYALAWLYLLIATADSDESVSASAADCAVELFFEGLSGDNNVDTRLSKALQAARTSADENTYLIQAGLRKLVTSIGASDNGGRVRRLVSTLLSIGDVEMAALLVEVDGTFMPIGKISTVFKNVTSQTERAAKVASLRMLSGALKARPRIILSSATTSFMFSSLVANLKTSTENEIEYVGSILGELVGLGGSKVQIERQQKLESIIDAAFNKLRQLNISEELQKRDQVISSQLMLIAGCVRFWGHSEGLPKIISIVETMVGFGRLAKSGSMLSQVIIRTVFSIAAEYRVIFTSPIMDSYLSSLPQNSAEFETFMQMLLKYEWHDTGGAGAQAPLKKGDASAQDQERVVTVMMGAGQHEEALATASMLQKYLAYIVDQIDQTQNAVALRIISKALDHYLIVVDRCLPLVVSMCFSAKLGISQAALATYAKICGQWPSSVLTKFVPGILRCSGDMFLRTGPFARMWQLAKANQRQRNIKLLIDSVARALRGDTSDGHLKMLITGLMQTSLDPKDAKLLKLGLMENVSSFSPRNQAHGPKEIARMILVHVFETWLTRRYGLYGTKIRLESPEDENIEYIDIDLILARFQNDRTLAKRAFEELLDEQYSYGSAKMEQLIYERMPQRGGPAQHDGLIQRDSSLPASKVPRVH